MTRASEIAAVVLAPSLALAACASAPAPAPAAASKAASAPAPAVKDDGRMGVHGMVVFGERRVYLSHIPMFRRPHDAQIILEVDLSPGGPKSFSDGLYTFEPERFALDTLVRGDARAFSGTLFKGSFEDGGTPLQKDVKVSIKRVVVARYLGGADGDSAEVRYLVLGEPADAYIIRGIGRAPGIDQIVRATVTGAPFDADRLSRAVEVTLEARGDEPLTAGEKLRVRADAATADVQVGTVLSCLAGPDFDKPCPR
jgi:hypothetical protein